MDVDYQKSDTLQCIHVKPCHLALNPWKSDEHACRCYALIVGTDGVGALGNPCLRFRAFHCGPDPILRRLRGIEIEGARLVQNIGTSSDGDGSHSYNFGIRIGSHTYNVSLFRLLMKYTVIFRKKYYHFPYIGTLRANAGVVAILNAKSLGTSLIILQATSNSKQAPARFLQTTEAQVALEKF